MLLRSFFIVITTITIIFFYNTYTNNALSLANQSSINSDKKRYIFKACNLLNRSVAIYQRAYSTQDMKLYIKAVQYVDASVGFLSFKNLQNDLPPKLLDSIGIIRSIILEKGLTPSSQELQKVKDTLDLTSKIIANNEQALWQKIREKQIEQISELQKSNILFLSMLTITLFAFVYVIFILMKLSKEKKLNQESFESAMNSFVSIMEEKDVYTAGHSQRVAEHSKQIALKMGLSSEEVSTIDKAGQLHDIGKIVTPEAILLKPNSFNDDEYALMKEHAASGANILNKIPSFNKISKIIRHHHEYYNGTGYPDQLNATEIPLLSRIMTIADSFDAMVTNRVYKPRLTIEQAIIEIEKNASVQFDPNIVPIAIQYFSSLKHIDLDTSLPNDEVSRHRFAYFFKDNLTKAYNESYLDITLQNNLEEKNYLYASLFDIHGLHKYNKKYGWKEGNSILRKVMQDLELLFDTKIIFRVHGNKFIILHKTQECSKILIPKYEKDIYLTQDIVTLNKTLQNTDKLLKKLFP